MLFSSYFNSLLCLVNAIRLQLLSHFILSYFKPFHSILRVVLIQYVSVTASPARMEIPVLW